MGSKVKHGFLRRVTTRLLGGLVVLLLASTCLSRVQVRDASPEELERVGVEAVLPLQAGVHRGVCLAHNYQWLGLDGYGSSASLRSKMELEAIGADWVSLTPFGYQSNVESTKVDFDPDSFWGESDERLEAEIDQARELGMKVMLKPHLWLGSGQWRGHLEPEGGTDAGWEAWFDSYASFILYYANLAERLEVEFFVVGLELASASWTQRELWVELISKVRRVYSGHINYAANWNEAEKVVFWDKVDSIGIQFFGPLTERIDAPYEELLAGVNRHLDDYEVLSKKYGIPVVLTEFGYKSIAATAIKPWYWPEQLDAESRKYDEINQALAYRALLEGVRGRDFVLGVYLWKWFTDVNTNEEGPVGFSPRGKIAEYVLERAYSQPPR